MVKFTLSVELVTCEVKNVSADDVSLPACVMPTDDDVITVEFCVESSIALVTLSINVDDVISRVGVLGVNTSVSKPCMVDDDAGITSRLVTSLTTTAGIFVVTKITDITLVAAAIALRQETQHTKIAIIVLEENFRRQYVNSYNGQSASISSNWRWTSPLPRPFSSKAHVRRMRSSSFGV